MIHYLKGIITDTENGMVVLDVNGIGYEINVPAGSSAFLSAGTGETVCIYTAMMVKEDDVSLYGFTDKESLAMFRLLLSVSGVGPKAALSILSTLDTPMLAYAIANGDDSAIQKANGVGKKTAQRVVIDLKDKVGRFKGAEGSPVGAGNTSKRTCENANRQQALGGLMSLGFTRSEAMMALDKVAGEDLSVEEYIREALRK